MAWRTDYHLVNLVFYRPYNFYNVEYGIVISSSRNNVSYCDQEQQAFGVQDQNYLADTCENLLVVRNLLRI
jgi:hypothetical protein